MQGSSDEAPWAQDGLFGLLQAGRAAATVLGGLTLIDRAVDRLGPQVARLALIGQSDALRLGDVGPPVLPPEPRGLAAVLAGLDWAAEGGATHVLTAEAEAPFLPQDLAQRLGRAATRTGTPLAIAATQEAGRLRRHPGFGLWPVALRDDLASALAQGIPHPTYWTDAHGAATSLFPDDAFFRVDSAEDLMTAQAMLGLGS